MTQRWQDMMAPLIPKLCLSTALGLGATTVAALQGRGIVTCGLAYLIVGQSSFLGLIARDLLASDDPQQRSEDAGSHGFGVQGALQPKQ